MEHNYDPISIIGVEALDCKETQIKRDERLFLLLSIFIGVISGFLVVCFRMSIEWLTVLFREGDPSPNRIRLLLLPALAGIVIAALTRYVFPAVAGSAVNQTKAAMYIHDGYISVRTMIGNFFLSTAAIGSGFSLGPEEPSLQIGAAVASIVGRRFGLSREKLRILAPVGAAAGLAAAFNAPVSAILFVIEEVIGQWTSVVLGSIIASAVTSVVVARWFWGAEPLFRVPSVQFQSSRELIAYVVLGVGGGIVAPLFSKAIGYLRPALRRQPSWARLLHPPLAGLIVGAIGYFGLPQVMGAGYGAIDQAMHGQFALKMLLLLAVIKIIATTISFASGTPGGMFAPTLFAGAMLGAAIGSIEKHFFPSLSGSVGMYALVGMGVLFAAFLRAPLTSIFMVLEVSGNYSIIVPVLVANTIAYFVSRALHPVSIFDLLIQQDGLLLPSMDEEHDERPLRFEDAAKAAFVPILEGTESLCRTKELLERSPELRAAAALLVRCSNGRWYAARQDELHTIFRELQAGDATDLRISLEARLGPERTPRVYPDQLLSNALTHFKRWPLLAVSNRAMHGVLEGVLSQEDVLQRYRAKRC